ncbi:MAG: chitobiase/beta-hexosaminidase C-terminal domain-containing protein [Paludibacteraceae bacterium]|nr:chitobiase/beta-hexosaminidase C-terminal domain-containing protein [Paludibacteraceae bacterium]
MRKIKLFLSLLMVMLLSVGNVWAADESVTFSEKGYSNQQAVESYAGTNFSIAFNKGTNSNAPKYFTSGTAIRAYGGNYFTVSSTTKTIAKIELGFGSSDGSNAITTDVDTYDNGTWTGSATSITFTIGGTSGNRRLASVAVTYEEGGDTPSTPTCATPTFDPEDGEKFDESIDVEINAEDGATIYYTTDGNAPTTSSSVYSTALHFTETTTLKAMAVKAGSNNSAVATATYTKMVTVPGYAIDFESELDAYVDWVFSNIGIRTSTITAHGGTYYGSNVNGNGNATTTAAIKTKAKVATPGVLTFYISKETNNTTASSWKAQVSADGSEWTDVETFDAKSMSKGTWNECTADLSEYSNVYVRIYYDGSNAIRAIDDIELAMASAVAKPSITGTDNFLTSSEISMACTTEGADVYYTTDGSDPKTSGTKYTAAFSIDDTKTIKAIAKVGEEWSAVAEATFTKATVMTVAQALGASAGANQYVKGIVSEIEEVSTEHGNATYNLKDEGQTNSIKIYRGKYLNNANFTAADQIIVGDEVIVFGSVSQYQSVNQFAHGNYIVAIKPAARLAWSAASYDAELGGSNSFPTLTNTNSVTVTYSSSNADAATIDENTGAITLVAAGTTTITAAFAGNETYKANSVSYTLEVKYAVIRADISFEENGGSAVADLTQQTNLPNPLPVITKAGKNFGGWFTDSELETPAVAGATVASTDAITLYAKWLEPYSVAEALGIIEAMETNGETETAVYVAGIITPTTRSFNNSYKSITYMISDDGTATDELKVYSGKGVNDANFTAVTDLDDEDQVVVYGKLKKYQKNNTSAIEPEVNQPNYIYSLSRKAEAGIEWGVASFDAYIGQSNTFPTLTNPNSLTVAYSSTNTTAATIDPATGDITLGTTPNVSTIIKATFAGNAGYKEAEVSYTLNVYNPTNPGTITYEENGGSTVADVTTLVDNFPDPLPTPTKENNIFAGWWTTSTFNDGTQAVAGAPMDGNVILYAKWTEIPVWAYTYTSNVTLSTEGGTSASAAKVKFYGEEGDGYDAIKAGTGSAQGAVVVNVPAGATALHFHAYGWNSESVGLTVTAPTGVTVSPATEISINSNSGIASNSPFTLAEGSTPMTDAYYVVELSGNTTETTLTFSATTGKRFVLFGVNQEGGIVPVLDHIVVTGTATALEYEVGDVFNPAGLGANAIYTLGGVEQEPVAIDAAEIEWSFEPATIAANTTAVTVTATYEGKSATKEVSGLTVNVPEPEIIVSAASLAFGNKAKGVAVDDKELTVTLKSVENATLTITGDGASAFSVTPAPLTASGTVTVSASTDNVGTFNATLTISDGAGAAMAQEVALSITVEASDDLSGTWNLVTDAAELMPGMQVIVASVADNNGDLYTLGGPRGNNGDNRLAVAGIASGNVLTPAAGTKVLTLVDAGDGKYALQLVNGNYLYAASSSSNYLKEKETLDANGTWSISISEGKANIVAQGTNTRNTIRHNSNSGSILFSCYASGQQDVVLYAKPFDYSREIAQGVLSTTCLPNGGQIFGASIFEIAYMDYEADGTTPHKIYFDEVEGGIMEAGMPYVVLANEGSAKFGVYYTDNENKAAQSKDGLVGYMGEGRSLVENEYFIYDNKFFYVSADDATSGRILISNNRAFINLSQVPGYQNEPVVVPAPGRRRVSLGNGASAPAVATGMENVQGDNVQSTKVLINGQLFILRGEKMYDATGRLVK